MLANLVDQGRIVGHGYQAIVRRLQSPAGDLVVKSPHPNPVLAWFGLRAIRREAQIYERLRGVAGIPRSFGLAGRRHLALEYIDGPTLRIAAPELRDRERFFARLLSTLRGMHSAGVAHGDLKRKENTLVGAGETPYIIDFGIACLARPDGHGLARRRFEMTRQMDFNAYIKLKYGSSIEQMTGDDARLYRPLIIERAARGIRVTWQTLTMRRARKRLRARRAQDDGD